MKAHGKYYLPGRYCCGSLALRVVPQLMIKTTREPKLSWKTY